MRSTVKLVTYNIKNGEDSENIISNLSSLVDQGTNIFCLQEVRKLPNKPFIGDKLKDLFNNCWKIEFFLGDNPYDFGTCLIWNSQELKLIQIDKVKLPSLDRLIIRN